MKNRSFSALLHKTEKNLKSLIKIGRKLGNIFFIQTFGSNFCYLIMRLTNGLLLHVIGIPTATEQQSPSIIVREDTKSMAIMVSLLEARLTQVCFIIGATIIANEHRTIVVGDGGTEGQWGVVPREGQLLEGYIFKC